MLPLRYPWLWWAFGWLLVAGVIFGSLLPGDWVPAFSPSDKLLHAGSYLILMLWFAGLYPRERHFVIAVLLFALGFVLDFAQGMAPYRDFDWRDVAANAGGILVGLLLSRYVFEGWCRRVEQLFISS
ncbi:MAG TPA: VanZ family protein [Gammaproteobacteria bacterium]|nr:VanZ family protein [Gammaproteobacteria bacterium]